MGCNGMSWDMLVYSGISWDIMEYSGIYIYIYTQYIYLCSTYCRASHTLDAIRVMMVV